MTALTSSKDLEAPLTDQALTFPPGAALGRRLVGLDLLRAAAIVLVLCGHVQFRQPDNSFGAGFWFVTRQAAVTGVDLFFVLSGFLIGGILLTELRATGSIRLGRFFARRLWRLWPAYFVAVLAGWQWYHHIRIMHNEQIVKGVPLWQMWPFLAHVQNYYDVSEHHFGAAAVMQTWTVASLIHCYLFIALLLLLLRKNLRWLPWAVAATFAFCLACRWYTAPVNAAAYNAWRHYFPTHLRLDEPMFGVLLAYLVLYHGERLDAFLRRAWWVIVLAGLAALLPAALRREEGPRFLCIWGYTLAGVGCGGFIICAWWWERRRLARGKSAGIVARAFAWIGVWSYSIYLWHQPWIEHFAFRARQFVGNHLVRWESPWHYTAVVLVYIGMAVAFGAVMYYVVEVPFLILRERLARREGPGLARGAGFPAATPAR